MFRGGSRKIYKRVLYFNGGGGGGCLKASIKLEVLLRLRPCEAQNVFTIIFSVVRALMAAWCFPLPCYCFLVLCHVFSQHLDCAVSIVS